MLVKSETKYKYVLQLCIEIYKDYDVSKTLSLHVDKFHNEKKKNKSKQTTQNEKKSCSYCFVAKNVIDKVSPPPPEKKGKFDKKSQLSTICPLAYPYHVISFRHFPTIPSPSHIGPNFFSMIHPHYY